MRTPRQGHLGVWTTVLVGLLLCLPIPDALGAFQPVRPILECVTQEGPSQYTAVYGYKNENAVPITIPVGANNKFTPTPQNRGQTTVFQPGRTPYDQGAFRVPFNGSNLVWTLKGPDGGTRTSTASANSKRCPGPTLTGLDPASLSLTQGGSGTLIATISAPQASATTITLTSSAPAVASVPASVAVPVGQVAVPIPVTVATPGVATITAALNGSSRQSSITVLPAGSTLTSLLPATLQVTQGASGTLTTTISAAQGTDTVIPLSSTDAGIVSVPVTVTVPAGAVAVPAAVAGLAPGTATVTAGPLNGTSAQSQVTVVPPLPTVVSLAPPVLPLTEGSGGTLTVTLNASQPTDTEVPLITSDPVVVGLPAGTTVTISAGAVAVPVPVVGLSPGAATVTASLNGTTATSAVTVQPPLPAVSAFACPAALTVGATGQCTLTLNATQLTDTLVPLATSDPGIVTVPESVTVAAGAVAVPVPVSALTVGIATLTAGPLNATSKQATVQVQPLPPTLVGLAPSPATLLVGSSTTLTLTLTAAPVTDTAVALVSTPTGLVTLPPLITVPAGQLTVPVPVTALTPGSAVLTAGPLNGSTVVATVTVNQLPPAVTALTPSEVTLPRGTADSLTVTIAPVQVEPTTVPLTSSNPATVEIPTSVPVPAGSSIAAFPVIGRSIGTSTVTAGPLGGTSVEATVTVTPPVLVTLTLASSAVTLAVGQTQALVATGTYTDGTTQDLTATAAWTCSDTTIATITSPGGVVTARAVGQATITVTADGKSATATIGVTPPMLTVLALTPTLPTRAAGQAVQFVATGTFTDGTTPDLTGTVTWTSSDPSVATINSPGGLATALAAGQTTITATHTPGMTASTTLTVTAPVVVGLNILPANPSVPTGLPFRLAALGLFNNDTTQDVTAQVAWTSAAPFVANVSHSGLVTGLTAGTTTVTATHPTGITASTTVTVILPPPTIKSLEPLSLAIPQGRTGALTVTLNAVQPGETTISLTSSDPAVAAVPATIIVPGSSVAVPVPVAAVAPGIATITATLNGSNRQSNVSVTPAGPTLMGLSPIALQMAPGASCTLTLTLSAAADTDTTVVLSSSDPMIATLPAGGNVTIPAGQISQSVSVSGVAPGQATISATLDDTVLHGQVTVTTRVPTVVSLLPTALSLAEGARGELTLTLAAAQPSAVSATITTGDSWAVGLPAEEVAVPANTTTMTFPITGVHSSVTTVTATLNGSAAVAGVSVRKTLPTVHTVTCPPAVAVGATGQCTLSLNAIQPVAVDLPVAATDPTVVGVATTVQVPANSRTATFAVAGLAIGSAEIVAGPLTETTQRAGMIVVAPVPTLAALDPNAIAVAPGATTTLTVTVNAVQPTATTIPVSLHGVEVVVRPISITVPAGELTTTVPLTGLTVGTATLTVGPLNGTQRQATVTVSTAPPTLVAVTPAPATMPDWWVAPLTVHLSPVQETPTVVTLATDDQWAWVLSVPPTVTIPAGASEAALPVLTFGTGTATVTAGPLNGSTTQATVSVVDTQTTRFTIEPAAANIAQGETQQFKALHAYSTGIVQDDTPWSTWTTSNPAVAKIVAKGRVSGLVPGTATITARSEGGGTATAVLTVGWPPATALAITPATATLVAGNTFPFHATATFADGTTQDVTSNVAWTSSDPAVATVAASGLATGLAPGTITITAQLGTVAGTATLTVAPPPLVSLTLRPTDAVWSVGSQIQFRAIGVYADSSLGDVTAAVLWGSSTPIAAIASASGVATALAPGTTIISATHPDGVAAATTFTVVLSPPTITALVPSAGPIGGVVNVLGASLGTATAGAVNGTPAPVTVQSDAHLTVTVPAGAESGPITITTAEGLAISPQPFIITTAPTIVITSPAAGATFAVDRVFVRGTVNSTSVEVGVEVNGVLAYVNGTAWAVEVPLGLGDNLLTATALDATGVQATATVPVTAAAAPRPLVLQAVPRSGVTPLPVAWQHENRTGRALVQFELDPTGSGAFDAPVPSLDGIRTTYATMGLFAPTVRATDDQGQVYLAETLLNVLDRTELDTHLQARWAAMKAALQSGAIETALGLFLPSQVERYRTLFTALQAELPQIAHEMADIQLVTLTEQRAKYRLRRTELYGGQWVPLTYYLYFVRDATGAWAIEGF